MISARAGAFLLLCTLVLQPQRRTPWMGISEV